jgi:5-methylcytosine-specific restriction endonuclease McrA
MHKETYAQRLLDPRWQQLRLRVFERDKWTCRVCDGKEKTLHAHHVHYHPYAEGPWDYDIETIITLCADCHSDEHTELDAAKANLILAFAKKGYVTSFDFDCLSTLVEKDGRP